jgi:hypothetical protein
MNALAVIGIAARQSTPPEFMDRHVASLLAMTGTFSYQFLQR